MKPFIKTFLSSKPKKHFNLTRALSCLEVDLQMLCRLKLSWSSMCIPSNLTDETTSTMSFPIKNCLGLFSENHLIAFWDSVISISTSNVTDFANDDNVLSSAKVCKDAFLMQKKKSFKNALNNIGPTIEPCPPKLCLWSHYKRCWHEHIVFGFSNTCKYISEHCH